MYSDFLKTNFENMSGSFMKLQQLNPIILKVANLCIGALKNGNKIMFCGNGGAAAISQHLATELVGRYKLNRPAYNSIALTADSSILTALGNDFGFESIFERQIEGLGKRGDVLFGLSTSGNSKNILLAFQKAKAMGIMTVAMTGQDENQLSKISDYTLNVPSEITNNIQELHLAVGHSICEIIEKALVSEKFLQ